MDNEITTLRAQLAEAQTLIATLEARCAKLERIHIVFDGPPGPESGRFVEVEDAHGNSLRLGEWIERDDGYWVLAIDAARTTKPDESGE